MKSEKVIWGLLLVFVGGVILFDNLGVIDFYWSFVWRFWPVLLILSGVNMLFSKSDSKIGGVIAIGITCAVLIFIGYQGISGRDSFSSGWLEDGNRDSATRPLTTILSEPFVAGTRKAELSIKGGASSFNLKESTSNLFEASATRSAGRYSLKKVSRDSVEILDFRMTESSAESSIRENEVNFKMNSAPLWDIKIQMGAGELDFDLSPYNVEKVSLEGGAASFKLKMGMPETATTITIKTGVSDSELFVPRGAGCQIKTDSGLSFEDFDGFTRQPDGSYATSNFNSTTKRIIIAMKGGLSNIEVKRY
jgi:hypothetical protein